MSEETTKGLTISKLIQLNYPKNQDSKENGVIWYKEDSYKDHDKKLATLFSNASKSLNGKANGRPDFTITSDNPNLIVVIECKEDVADHQQHDCLDEYKSGIGSKEDIQKYAINGALHYAQYVNNECDVIAIAVSGKTKDNMRISSFVLPENGGLSDIELIEDGDYDNTIMSITDYQKVANRILGRSSDEEKAIFSALSSYAIACANFLRANGISAKDRAGFISAVVLALTNEDSQIYKLTSKAFVEMESHNSKHLEDYIGDNAIDNLFTSLKDIWINKDKIPDIKQKSLEEYYNKILTVSLLNPPECLDNRYFKFGKNILTCCLYSIYQNITRVLKQYTNLDIMGTFYTVFLKYAKGDAQDKGIVLTPKHITELFCDLAEHYLGKKLDDSTKVLDICCGTGGFLISALNRMDSNINCSNISESLKDSKKEKVRKSCLIGVESEPEMFALAYANMRFHGDGKSNLYSCSSLLKDSKNKKGIAGKDLAGNPQPLKTELEYEYVFDLITKVQSPQKREIDVGMINPPYALTTKKKNSGEKQDGQSELDFIYSMLSYLKEGGIGIAIVPISCASDKGKKMREIILKEHTLLACMTMPLSLFKNSDVGTSTCIMVFQAHKKHNDSSGVVFMSRWLDDGFITIPHNGRYDKNNMWNSVKEDWLRQLEGLAAPDPTTYLRKKIALKDECLAEAYIETNYSKLDKADFIKELKKYALYRFMHNNVSEDIKNSELPYWLLDNYELFISNYSGSFSDKTTDYNISTENWKTFKLTDNNLFDLSSSVEQIDRKVLNETEGNIPYISRTQNNNGVILSVIEQPNRKINDGNCITIGLDTRTIFYQKEKFYTGQNIQIIRNENLNPFNAFFIITMLEYELFKYSWARGLTLTRLKKFTLKLPVTPLGLPDWKFMENYIKSLPFSSKLID